jgi:hypothetical protein
VPEAVFCAVLSATLLGRLTVVFEAAESGGDMSEAFTGIVPSGLGSGRGADVLEAWQPRPS